MRQKRSYWLLFAVILFSLACSTISSPPPYDDIYLRLETGKKYPLTISYRILSQIMSDAYEDANISPTIMDYSVDAYYACEEVPDDETFRVRLFFTDVNLDSIAKSGESYNLIDGIGDDIRRIIPEAGNTYRMGNTLELFLSEPMREGIGALRSVHYKKPPLMNRFAFQEIERLIESLYSFPSVLESGFYWTDTLDVAHSIDEMIERLKSDDPSDLMVLEWKLAEVTAGHLTFQASGSKIHELEVPGNPYTKASTVNIKIKLNRKNNWPESVAISIRDEHAEIRKAIDDQTGDIFDKHVLNFIYTTEYLITGEQ